jgi:hypothetical protein
MQFYLNGYKTGDPFIEDPHPSVAERPGGLVMCCGASPDRVLMRAGQHRDGLAQFSIGRQLAMQVGVDSQNVGQQHRVGGIGFGSRHRIPGPIPRGGQRIDRIHRPPVARSNATSKPRGVSIATGTGASAQSPASVSSSTNSVNPLGSSVMRFLATSCPSPSMMATSWRASAQSMPQNNVTSDSLQPVVRILRGSTRAQRSTYEARWPSLR